MLVDQSDRVSVDSDLGSVVEALVSLGWPERSAQEAVREASSSVKKGEGREVVLRMALSKLGANKSASGLK
jgi:Holliday junction resolvasome RuvABC DNA-binding subunit